MHTSKKNWITVVGIASIVTVALAGCSADTGDTGATSGGGTSAVDAALAEGGEITYWGWAPWTTDQIAAFEKEYPKVKVNFVNTTSASDQDLKLSTAISAGKGAPDVAQLEYQSFPQFELQESLADLSGLGFKDEEKNFTASAWSQVTNSDGIFGLPQDAGPMVMFYNKKVFDDAGVDVPATWDDYTAAAKTLQEKNPGTYITNDDGGYSGAGLGLIWQAGGHPFTIDGSTVSIDLQDEGSRKWADMWTPLLQDGYLASIPGGTADWGKALGDGSIATVVAGGWFAGLLQNSAPDGAGNWRVAPMPTYDGGDAVSAEQGGSGQAVLAQSKNKELAAGFLRFLNSDSASVDVMVAGGGFPTTQAQLTSADFLDVTSDYFGGQKVNEVVAAAAATVPTGWTYLPWQAYANSIYPDTVGKAYLDKADINDGLIAWQDANVTYGKAQGFTIG